MLSIPPSSSNDTCSVSRRYDPQTDSLTIALRDARIKESDEIRPGVIADFGYDGAVVRFEILRASKIVENAREMQFAVAD